MLLPQGYCALKPQLGSILRDARLTKKLKQAALAADVGVSRETVSKIETGLRVPRPQLLDRLIAVLELDWEDLAIKGECNNSRIFIDGYRGDQLNMIGKKAQDIRLGKGFSLAEMAKYLGSSPATLSRLERGQLARSKLFQDDPSYAHTEFEGRPVILLHERLRALLA